MALTMTRTRTQTALTKLAEVVANIHGELEAIDRLFGEHPSHRAVLSARKQKLESDRDALYLTLKQFDPDLDPTCIGKLDDWLTTYGRRGTKVVYRRYMAKLVQAAALSADGNAIA